MCSGLLPSISEPASEEQPPCSAERAFSEGRLMTEPQLRRKYSKLNRSAAGTLLSRMPRLVSLLSMVDRVALSF